MKRTDTGSSKTAGTYGYKNTRTLGITWKLLCHESVDKGSAYRESNQETSPLDGYGRQGDAYCINIADPSNFDSPSDDARSERSSQEEGISWENPDRRHCVNGERPSK